MKFCKVFDVKRYQQIVMLKEVDEDGDHQIRVYFHPEGYGLSSFVMAWPKDSGIKAGDVFKGMVMQDAIEVVDKFMAHTAYGGEH